ncbi:MAG TPA: hypothetical protein VK499_01195 [Propionibacteriaceae bacterium]|nr:hypothetical protein [Propionibacteriaceae bacterium]
MIKRTLGSSGQEVSGIGLGCMGPQRRLRSGRRPAGWHRPHPRNSLRRLGVEKIDLLYQHRAEAQILPTLIELGIG